MKKIFIYLIVLLFVLFGVGMFYDLDIAESVFMRDNEFSYFFEHFAPIVYGTIMMLSGAFIFIPAIYMEKINLFDKVFSFFVYILFSLFGIFMCYHYAKIFGASYGVAMFVVILLVTKRIPKNLLVRYRWVGTATLLIILCSMITVESLKPIFGRVRFRSMQDNFSLFSRWYKVNGSDYRSFVSSSEEIKSFPSGHSQWAGVTLTLSMIPMVTPKWQSKEKIVFLIALFYAFVVMFSRMVQGAHFLTDVIVGFTISFFYFWLFRKIIVVKQLNKY